MTQSPPIIQFSIDRASIQPGECARLIWHVEGVKAVYFYSEGEPWQQHGVVGHGEQQVCPERSTTYCLRVIRRDDTAEVHQIVVEVHAPQAVRLFSADKIEIQPGECVTFRWHVEGVKAVYFLTKGAGWQTHGVIGVGEQQVCPAESTTYRLRIVKRDDSVEVRDITILVRTPEVVQLFAADKTEILPGECVTFRWRVEGVKAVYFHAEGEPWQKHGVAGVAEQQVCPLRTAAYCLRVVKRDDSVEVREIGIVVRAPEVVQAFSVDRFEIQSGECATFRWHVEGVKEVYFYPECQTWQTHGVVGVGEQKACPAQTTAYCLRVVNRDGSVEVHHITVQVRN
jgi:plastocyanin